MLGNAELINLLCDVKDITRKIIADFVLSKNKSIDFKFIEKVCALKGSTIHCIEGAEISGMIAERNQHKIFAEDACV